MPKAKKLVWAWARTTRGGMTHVYEAHVNHAGHRFLRWEGNDAIALCGRSSARHPRIMTVFNRPLIYKQCKDCQGIIRDAADRIVEEIA